jgi:hypothetical protein
VPIDHVFARRLRGQAGAHREAAADALGHRHDVGLGGSRPFMRPDLAGPAGAALHLVIDQQQAVLVTQLAQTAQADIGNGAHAALALDRLDQNGGGFFSDRRFQRVMIAELDLVKAFHGGAEAFEIFRIAARIDPAIGATVEGAPVKVMMRYLSGRPLAK